MWAIDKRKRKRIFEKSDVPVPGILAVPGSTAVHVDPNRKTFTFLKFKKTFCTTFYNFYFYNLNMLLCTTLPSMVVTTEKIE